MARKPLKIENIDDLKLQELTEEESKSLRGGMIVEQLPQEEFVYRSYPIYPLYPDPHPNPDPYPNPDPKPNPNPINNIPCTNFPMEDTHLPWCAVIL